MTHRLPARVLRIIFGLLPLVALGRQLAVHLELGFSSSNFFSYFTNISNLLAGCVLLLSAVTARENSSNRVVETLRVIAVVNMALVGILFTLLLRDADVGALLPWVNFVHHYLMPCVVVLDWIVVPPTIRLGRRELLSCLVLPLAYVIYILVRGRATGWYPYPFLNPALVGGASHVAAYVLGITLAFITVGWLLIVVGNWRRAN
jgi:hypothetical protein